MNRLLLPAALVGAAILSLSTAEAAAPPRLVSATPPKDSHVPWPKQIILKFNQPVTQADAKIQMIKPDGSQIPLEAALVSEGDRQVLSEVKTPTLPGPYMVMWQVKSAAGAPAKGDYTFFVQ